MTNDLYDAYYFQTGCGQPYSRNAEWLAFFGNVAQSIIDRIRPITVLDAGCAWGLLVESLRDRGVEAFGVDISEYAISQVRADIRPFCQIGSIATPFMRRYDLIVCIEVLEHMPPIEAERAIANLCAHTDDVLFSSSPDDYREATHFNVQPTEYWAEQFALHGFVRDIEFEALFITPWALRFRRTTEPLHRVIRGYERGLTLARKAAHDTRQQNLDYRQQVQQLAEQLAEAQTAQQTAETARQLLESQLLSSQLTLKQITQGIGWKLLQSLNPFYEAIFPKHSAREHWLKRLFRIS